MLDSGYCFNCEGSISEPCSTILQSSCQGTNKQGQNDWVTVDSVSALPHVQGSFNQQQPFLVACTTIISFHYIRMTASHQISFSWMKSPEDIHPITGFRHIQDLRITWYFCGRNSFKFHYSTCNLKISENEAFCDWNPVFYRKLQTFAVQELKIHLSAYLSTTGRASCGWNPAHGTVMYAFLASVPCVLWNVKYTCIAHFL